MNRLTGYNSFSEVYAIGMGCKNKTKTINAILRRLAAYEDTGLTPEEIDRIVDAYGRGQTLRSETSLRLGLVREIKTDRLRELAQADEDGRLVVLPCKVGGTVYMPSCKFPAEIERFRVEGHENGKSGVFAEWVAYDHGPEGSEVWDDGDFDIEDIGKTVFLAHEEAERALAAADRNATTTLSHEGQALYDRVMERMKGDSHA